MKMKTRRLVTAFALLAALSASSISATADEKLDPIQTSLGNTTIGGYVDSSAGWEFQPPVSGRHGGWWWEMMFWFGFDR
jgi:ABC-type amino acid transport substrate-binding protein